MPCATTISMTNAHGNLTRKQRTQARKLIERMYADLWRLEPQGPLLDSPAQRLFDALNELAETL